MRSGEEAEEAVSPVIATVLLLAITVLLTSGIYIMVQDAVQAPDKGTPYGQLTSQSLENGFQVVRVSDLSHELMINTIKFQIISPNGTVIDGLVNDASVYGAIGSQVTFQDRDAGLTLNRGDYFIINATDIGSDEGGWTFRLIFMGAGTRGTADLGQIILPATDL
ncbi:MAG TPA: archaellin/type IV pilin N-terminal domain-containing protein [Candidatus Thalassarchaeaceae archaeon]|jgi:flagellin-like protein|nr:archaellin/type IV pilin N-terminal domain-containing protein [Candidatus Thalassarchaeaceae archaeon]